MPETVTLERRDQALHRDNASRLADCSRLAARRSAGSVRTCAGAFAVAIGVALTAAFASSSAAATQPAAIARPAIARPVSDTAFCLRAQQLLTASTVMPRVVRHETWTSFKESKSSIRPFEIHQFVTADAQDRRLPALVSCKLKTADHIAAVYGAAAAGSETRSCTAIDRDTVERVFAALTPEERARVKIPQSRIVYDDEQVTHIGPSWLQPFQYVRAAGNELHLATRALVVNWNDLLWKLAPERVRGVHYCHVVAPEYLRRLVLGEAVAPAAAR